MKRRRINIVAFERQLAEAVIGPDSLVELEINASDSIWVKIPINLDDDDEYMREVMAQTSSEEMCLRMLALKPGMDADADADERARVAREQLDAWLATGRKPKDLVVVFMSELNATEERAKNFRYRG